MKGKQISSVVLSGVVVVALASTIGVGFGPPQETRAPNGDTILDRYGQSFEPNESPAEAEPISPNSSIEAEITENDVDWFAVDVSAGHRIEANVSKPIGRSGLEITIATLEGEVDSLLVSNEETTGFVADTTDSNTTYYVRVQGRTDDANTRYALEISTRKSDSFEPNEQPSAAVALTSRASGEITEHDVDYFTFVAEAGERVVVNLTKPAGQSDLEIVLFNLNREIETRRIDIDETQGFVADTADTATPYFVLVRGQNGRDNSPYTLELDARKTDAFEPNENRIEAVRAPESSNISGEITEYDVDWFRFDADVGDRVVVNVSKPAGRSDLEVSLYTPNGEVDSTTIDVDETAGFVADTAEVSTIYFVQVQGAERDVSPYTLNVSTVETET